MLRLCCDVGVLCVLFCVACCVVFYDDVLCYVASCVLRYSLCCVLSVVSPACVMYVVCCILCCILCYMLSSIFSVFFFCYKSMIKV